MSQIYTRNSIRNSLTHYEKNIVENIKNVVNEKQRKNIGERLNLKKNWDKLVYTLCILFVYLPYGLTGNLFGPSMVDMKFLYSTSTANINYGNTFSSGGYIIGSLTGFLYKYINRQLSFIVNVVLMGVSIGSQPLFTSLWLFYLMCFLSGFGGGVWDSGNCMWVVEMWKENSAPVFQLSQMMYGLGSIIGPLLVTPYIYGDLSNKSHTTDVTTTATFVSTLPTIINTNTTSCNNTSDDNINYCVDRSILKVPYFIGGGVTLIIPMLMLVMFFIKRYQIPEKQSLVDKNENKLAAELTQNPPTMEISPGTRKLLIALVALSLNSYSGLESTFFSNCSTYYQYLPINLPAPTAAKVMAVMISTFTAGRAVSAYISSKLKAEVMITYHLVILFISFAFLYFGQNSIALIYTGNAILGFGFSAMWPSYLAFSEKYLSLTDKVTSIFSFVSGFFALLAPFIIGPLIEKHPEVFLYVEIALFAITVILFIMIMVILKRSQRYPVSYTLSD